MKLTLKNVGCLSEAVIEPRDLTVFCGANNTGKTYAMYVLWSLITKQFNAIFPFLENSLQELKEKKSINLSLTDLLNADINFFEQKLDEEITEGLPKLFSASKSMFSNSRVEIKINQKSSLQHAVSSSNISFIEAIDESSGGGLKKSSNTDKFDISYSGDNAWANEAVAASSEYIKDLLFGYYAEKPFLLPAERGGLNIFQPDLDIANAQRASLIRRIKQDSNQIDTIEHINVAQYAEPIDRYLHFLRMLPKLRKGETEFHDLALYLQKTIAQVDYQVTHDGLFNATPQGGDTGLGIHLTSSTVKNFFGLWAYLETIASQGDCLMIDEPELNLHPDNQRLIARLLVRLVNRGIKVVISTHSDYIVREINNMIMLGNPFEGRDELERTWGYDADGSERLRVDQVAAYHFEASRASKIEISPEYGMEVKSMDEAINRMNQSNSEIYFALQDILHPIKTPDSIAD
jgi:hypothetical protein